MYEARIGFVEALIAAVERRDEVIRTVAEASDEPSAQDALGSLLGISPDAARSVIDMRLGRLTRAEVARLVEERAVLRQVLQEGPPPAGPSVD